MMKKKVCSLGVLLLVFVPVMVFSASINYEEAWDVNPDIPSYDPAWKEFEKGWAQRWEHENLDKLADIVQGISKRHPNKVEPYLWLARLSFLDEEFSDCEEYCVKAHEIDPSNVKAFKILISVLPNQGGKQYILEHYRQWFDEMTPLPTGRMLPDLEYSKQWDQAIKLWGERMDIKKAIAAGNAFQSIADAHPEDGNAQAWVCRINYAVGAYYTSIGEHDTTAMPYYQKGISYGEKALDIIPHSVPVNYWYELCLGRSIQFKSLFTKARYLKPMVKHLLFAKRENVLYNCFGPVLAASTLIRNGGWVCEKGMAMAGISMEYIYNGFDLLEMVYPDKFYGTFGKADLLAYEGHEKEAEKILLNLLKRDPKISTVSVLDNKCVLNFSRILLKEIQD
ncbi:MAG: hypothetical protein U9P80_05520 [Thermodesulfobacteriota bacterium]|nr:hypothetical protein [Thermodesulfobacteriota bacterium]